MLEQVKKKKVCITKRGVPIAEVIPVNAKEKGVFLNAAGPFIGDIVSPVAEDEREVHK